MYAYPIRARCVFADRASSMTPQRRHTGGFSTETLTTQRSCSSLAGCIISKALLSAVKSTPLSIWRNRLAQVSRPGGYLGCALNGYLDNSDAQSWYLLGRCYMSQQKYSKAYEAYQQAVYRDGRNPTFWCSIGVLYYQINQYRDALDAYSRAIRLNPYISEVWYDLGTLVSLLTRDECCATGDSRFRPVRVMQQSDSRCA